MNSLLLYPKLAFSGIGKNRKTYIPYILTCSGIIMMYYIVYFLSENPFLKTTYGGDQMQVLMNIGRALLIIFSGFFLFYTNSFLVRRRRKEFGLYNILGMGKNNIAGIMFFETAFIYIISLAVGLGLGILFSKAAELIVINIIQANIHYEFSVNFQGIVQTAIYYGLMFLLITLVAVLKLHLSDPIRLLRSESTGEKPPKANPVLAVIGAVMLAAAYIFSVTVNNIFVVLLGFFAAVLLVIIATYFLFIAGSVVICKLFRKNKKFYYKPNHFVSISQMAFRMKKNGAGLATICILSTMVLVTVSTTVCLYAGTESSIRSAYPRNIMLDIYPMENAYATEEELSKVEKTVDNTLSRQFDTAAENTIIYRNLANFGYISDNTFISEDFVTEMNSDYDTSDLIFVIMYPLSDYNRIFGKNEALADDEALFYRKEEFKYDEFTVSGLGTFRIKGKSEDFFSDRYRSVNSSICLIVSDKVLEEFNEKIMDIMFNDPEDHSNGMRHSYIATTYGFDVNAKPDIEKSIEYTLYDIYHSFNTDENGDRITTEYDIDCLVGITGCSEMVETYRASTGGLLFLGIIFGAIFLCAAVLIMYYKQISEGYDDCSKFEILQKVGMTDREIKKSINSQVLTVFFLPLIAAGVHLAFAFPLLTKLLKAMGLTDTKLFIIVTLLSFAVFAAMYILVYVLTSKIYYRIVSGRKEKR